MSVRSVRRRESMTGRTGGERASGELWRLKRRVSVSEVRSERVGVLGPRVCRRRRRVWRRRESGWEDRSGEEDEVVRRCLRRVRRGRRKDVVRRWWRFFGGVVLVSLGGGLRRDFVSRELIVRV